MGTYVHGLFADDRQRAAWLARLGAGRSEIAYDALIEATLDQLAAHIQESYNCAGRAELIDSEQLHREINLMKDSWRKGILPGQRQ